MKKFSFILLAFVFVFSFGATVPKVYAEQIQTDYKFRAYGDSISAGYGLTDYQNYTDGNSIICLQSYPQVFARDYIDEFDGIAKGFGVSGDKSQDLAEDLQPYLDQTASDYNDFMATNYFTLCIGANNVLGPAMSNLSNYIMGNISDDDYRVILNESYNQFVSDYTNVILPALTQNSEAKVLAMTIFNPYKYTTLENVQVDTGSTQIDATVKSMLPVLNLTFTKMLNTTMEYLEQINQVIRNSASQNVVVVDIYSLFETFTQEQYLQYINANASNVVIDSECISGYNLNYDKLTELFKTHCDPHPTAQGHEVIANEHQKNLPVLVLQLDTDLSSAEDNDTVVFNVIQVGGQNYSYRLNKSINNNLWVLDQQDNANSLSCLASDLNGSGVVFVEALKNNNVVAVSNQVEFEYQSKGSNDPVIPTDPVEPSDPTDTTNDDTLPQNQNLDIIIIVLIGAVCVITLGVVIFIIIKSLKHK